MIKMISMIGIDKIFHSDVKFTDALLYALIGIVVVFVVLAVLVIILTLFEKIFTIKIKKHCESEKETENVQQMQETGDDCEVTAAITAAITIILESESPSSTVAKFRIRSLKEIR